MALVIPVISVLGVMSAALLKARDRRRWRRQGLRPEQIAERLYERVEPTRPNWWILGGSLLFVVFTLSVGLNGVPYSEEIVFGGSLAIVAFLIVRLTRELEPEARNTLVGTALVIFVFRAIRAPARASPGG